MLAAAAEVFVQRGFGRASIEDVCEAAGFTRGAFYSNFASLDEMFLALAAQRGDLLIAQLTGALADGHADDLRELVSRVLAALTLDRDWIVLRTEFYLHAARHSDAADALLAHREQVLDTLTPMLTATLPALVGGPFRQDPRELTRTIVSLHDAAMLDWLLHPVDREFRDRLGEQVIGLLAAP